MTSEIKPTEERAENMTLRDYFAGQALAGIATQGTNVDWSQVSAFVYQIADAMLAEREKSNDK